MSTDSNKRMAKNTMYLYIRTFVSVLISFYTSRKILEALGIEDFGIFNVVGGVISMLSFLNGSMSVATQRFLTVELGKNDHEGYNRVFNMAILIHIILAMFVLIVAETVGLWFVNVHLNIPSERIYAANWVFQAAILSAILGILQTPYNASIIAHEHMHICAYVGLGDAFGKLVLVLFLSTYPYDRLLIWGFLLFILQFIAAQIYRIYCIHKFDECKLRLVWDKSSFYSMVCFTGWNMFGTIAWLLKDQGGNILMNLFGGPIINAARGVSYQVTSAIQNLTGNFQNAVTPQLTKNLAANHSEAAYRLLCQSSKISYYLLFIIVLPVALEIDFILDIWLIEVPPMAPLFTRIIIVEALLSTLGSPMITALMATGNIKWYQIVVGGILLLNIPISYILLHNGLSITTPLIVSVLLILLADVIRVIFCKYQIGLSLKLYTQLVIVPITIVTLLSLLLPLGLNMYMQEGWRRLLFTCFISVIMATGVIYTLGLTVSERKFIMSLLRQRIKRYF